MHGVTLTGEVMALEPARPPSPLARDSDRDTLTVAKPRIACLAAGGATNRRIAADRFISAKTVEFHLTSISRKLDTASREELGRAR